MIVTIIAPLFNYLVEITLYFLRMEQDKQFTLLYYVISFKVSFRKQYFLNEKGDDVNVYICIT